jgi:hypothetical protein
MTRAAFLAEIADAITEAEKLGVLTLVADTIKDLVAGKPAEAARRAERGAKAALARKVIGDA